MLAYVNQFRSVKFKTLKQNTSTQIMLYKLLTNHMPAPTKPAEHSLFNNAIYIPGSESHHFYVPHQQITHSTDELKNKIQDLVS